MSVQTTQKTSAMPDVSVVVPCLNEGATIADAVSVARQAFATWPGTEAVIVADNGATDGSAALAQAAGSHVLLATERGYGAVQQASVGAFHTATPGSVSHAAVLPWQTGHIHHKENAHASQNRR